MNNFQRKIRENLQDDFEVELFDSSVSLLNYTNNQTRFNSFSTNIRELLRHVFERLAPEKEVMQCVWYHNELKDRKGATRKQRMLYAIKGGLSDEFIETELNVEIYEITHEVKKVIDELSKYTHITEETFDVSQDKGDELVDKTMEAIILFFDTIKEFRDEIAENYERYITPIITDTFYEEFPSELDELATHCFIENIEVKSVSVISINSSTIKIETEGTVYVEEQYGSDSDQKNGDGLRSYDSFPFNAIVEDDVCNPKNVEIENINLNVDTDRFYE